MINDHQARFDFLLAFVVRGKAPTVKGRFFLLAL